MAQVFHDHVKELRGRILWIFLSISASGGIAYALRVPVINALQHPLGAPLFYTSPAGSFNFVMQLSMVIGLFITLPVIVYHLVRFIEPALPVRIKKSIVARIIIASFGLALAGCAFGFYYMIPMSLKFFAGYSNAAIKPWINANEYLSYIIGNLVIFALVFQIPLIVLFINWVKPLKPTKLLRYQRHVIVGSFAIAIILPFTYDPISQFIVAIPIVVLYYISVIMLWIAHRHDPKIKSRPAFEIKHLQPTQSTTVRAPRLLTSYEQPTALAQPRRLSTDGFVASSPALTSIRPQPNFQIAAASSTDMRPERPMATYRKLQGRPMAIDDISPMLST